MAKSQASALTWHVDDRQWKVGVAAMPKMMSAAAEARLRATAQNALDRALERVHVDSGALRDTGRLEEFRRGAELVIMVVFGGDGVVYADIEENLHPYLEPSALQEFLKFDTDVDMLTRGPYG